jgi:tetratricopeptide (TPR) repeat protein
MIERRMGNETAAERHLRQALERNPSYAEAHYELATGYLAAGDAQRALDTYHAALAARPQYAEALFGAARAALDLKRNDEARRDYETFIRVAPPEYARQVAAAREAIRRLQNR